MFHKIIREIKRPYYQLVMNILTRFLQSDNTREMVVDKVLNESGEQFLDKIREHWIHVNKKHVEQHAMSFLEQISFGSCSDFPGSPLKKYFVLDSTKNHSFLTLYARRFGKYFQKRKNEIVDLKTALQQGMDNLSQDIIDRVYFIYQLVAGFTSINENFLRHQFHANEPVFIPLNWILSENEKSNAGFWDRIPKAVSGTSFILPKDVCIPIEFFATKRSLAFLPPCYWNLHGKDVLDCGANIGDSSLIYSEFSPQSIHAFEPGKDTFETLKNVVEMNNKSHLIIPINKAIGYESGMIHFFTSETNDYGASCIYHDGKQSYEVESISLDDYVESNSLNVGLIKMDIEGTEYDAIRGAVKTIQKYKPLLFISIYHTPEDFFEIKPWLEALNLGYRFIIRQLPTMLPFPNEIELIGYIPDRESPERLEYGYF